MEYFDRLLPSSVLQQPRELRRARLVIGTCLTLSVVIVIGLVARWLVRPLSPAQVLLTLLSITVLMSIPWLLRRRESLALAGWLTTCIFMVLVGVQSVLAGGVVAPVAVLIPVIPLLATHLVGPVIGRRTMTGVFLAVVILTFVVPVWLELPAASLSPDQERAARGVMVLVGLVLVGALASGYEAQRKILEQQLRRSDALYRRLFDQSKDMVALATPKGKVIDVNQAGVELFGFESKDAFLRADTRTLYVDPAEREELMRRLEEDGFVRGYESRQRTRNGSICIVQGTTTAIRGSQGNVSLFLTILRDVTAERTALLENERMVRALEHKNEELKSFAYALSHDLKSPLITLRGFLDYLEEDARSGDLSNVEEDLKPILRTADRMQAMVEDLLQFATVGVDARSWSSIDVGDVAREVREMLAGRLQAGEIEVELDDALPTVYSDRSLLRALLLNLMDNGAKFLAGTPSPRLSVTVRPLAAGPVICVADNGPGIAKEHQEKIFGLFSKLETAGAPGDGTGIGLALCKKVVDLHGGEIWVESEGEGQGTTFCFTLPDPAVELSTTVARPSFK